jgi:hypothetical protein
MNELEDRPEKLHKTSMKEVVAQNEKKFWDMHNRKKMFSLCVR